MRPAIYCGVAAVFFVRAAFSPETGKIERMKKTNEQLIKGLPRRILLMLLDCGLIVLCYYIAILLRFDGEDAFRRHEVITAMAPMLSYILPIYMVVFWFGGLYEIMWEYAGMRDLARLMCLSGLATGFSLLFDMLFRTRTISGTVLIIGAVLNTAAVAGVRFLWRLMRTVRQYTHNSPKSTRRARDKTPLLIVGAGNAGAWAVNLCKTKNSTFGNPVVIVDDDLTKKNLRVQGVPVRGTISDIPELVRKYHIVEIVIAITTLKGERLREVINLCNSTHCRVRMLNDPQAVDESGKPVVAGLRELNTADFLSRDEIQLNNAQISEYLHDKIVLVTGGGGSIGSELCRQIMRYSPRQLLIFDIYENCAYELEMELHNKYGADAPIITLIGSIRDKARLDEVFETYHPSVVFHAAAHKHVPLMEVSPAEAVKNNVFGTKNLLTSAAEHDVERFVQLSTDKAVNPTNVMGATKRFCEMILQSMKGISKTEYAAVRFGNVLGSNGSVIPLFRRQIEAGGPVTVTDKRIIRYFMTIPEAAQLVLEAGAMAGSSEVFVLDMGQPVKILDLAENLIKLSGYVPYVDIDIVETGLRPGEKLYEELLMKSDGLIKTTSSKIFIERQQEISQQEMDQKLEILRQALQLGDRESIRRAMKRVVPTFRDPEEVNREASEQNRLEQRVQEG